MIMIITVHTIPIEVLRDRFLQFLLPHSSESENISKTLQADRANIKPLERRLVLSQYLDGLNGLFPGSQKTNSEINRIRELLNDHKEPSDGDLEELLETVYTYTKSDTEDNKEVNSECKVPIKKVEGSQTYLIAEVTRTAFADELILDEEKWDSRLMGFLDALADGQILKVAAKSAGFTERDGGLTIAIALSNFLKEVNGGVDYSHLITGINLKGANQYQTSPPESNQTEISPEEILRQLLISKGKGLDKKLELDTFIATCIESIHERLVSAPPQLKRESHIRTESELKVDDIANKFDKQLMKISIEDIESMLDRIATGKEKEYAKKVLQQISQFANFDGFHLICDSLKNYKKAGYEIYTEGRGSLPEVIHYFQKKGFYKEDLPKVNYIDSLSKLSASNFSTNNNKILLILDEALLESLERNPAAIKNLDRLKNLGYEIEFLHPLGWVSGINPFNLSTDNIIGKATTIMKEAQATQMENGITEALQTPVLERLGKIFLNAGLREPLGNINIISGGENSTLEDIANQLSPRVITKEELETEINSLGAEYKQHALEILDRDAVLFSQPKLAELSKIIEKKIKAISQEKLIPTEKVFYYIPVKQKSYGLATMQHYIANNIPQSQILTFKDKLPPEDSAIVLLDDCTCTGESGFKEILDIRKKGYKGEIILAPTLAATPAKILFQELSENLERLSFVHAMDYEPFIISDYYKNLSAEEKWKARKVLGELGYGKYGVSLLYPAMGPNGNNQFFQVKIATKLALCGVKGHSTIVKKQISTETKEKSHNKAVA